MTFEIIIIAIFASAAMLAAVLAVHNIRELSELRSVQIAAKENNYELELENRRLTRLNRELSEELEAERKNSRELRQIILDNETEPAKEQSETADIAPQEEPEMPLPEGHTNVISGMPYTAITNKKSEQWALQMQAYTGRFGIRCYFDGEHIYILAAMGSAYGRTIGDAFKVTLRCGTEMYVMLAEFKDDGTDTGFFGHKTTHADGYEVTCVLEFIYDKARIDSRALYAGNFCNIEDFGGLHGDGGDIVKIEYLGRKWRA